MILSRRTAVPSNPSSQQGFTILEAIVALAVFASGAMALYSLYATNIGALVKVGDTVRQAPLVRQAVERVAAINLTDEAAGEFEIDGMRFTWTARRVEPYRQGQTTTGFLGSFQIGLYDIDLSASEAGRRVGDYRMRLAGYQLLRPQTLQ
ncbi:MAG: prepilin-type N-terminal cleavage/methylation domain-containing protein [Gammaproteobacteria bacterium]|nr:prepilin-type N-terminal cleavage/methylation domain-containing protein [Gammaproteobacteria bacterium]MYK83307.1 prepilin-type N-terminal cleavage/methylation domain-containing protein [Gammaproteobacteria bacterium]